MSARWAIPAVLVATLAPVGIAACGGSGGSSAPRPAAAKTAAAKTATPTETAQTGAASVRIGHSRLGPILVDASGRTLYFFTQDKPRKTLCTSAYLQCTTSWPPLLTTGRPQGHGGVKSRLLGSLHRTKPSGSQVTYRGHPLYRYVDDKAPRDVNGQGMFSYWYVLAPSGRPITKK
jgi:predicted lipoprotein with Yx(FWY)xxD motif